MAARKSINARSKQAKPAARSAPRTVISTAVEEAIEIEREGLMRVHTLLSCAAIAMDAEELSFKGPHYLTVIEMCRDMVNQAINNLEPAALECSAAGTEQDVDEFETRELACELSTTSRSSRTVREPMIPYQLH